MVEQRTRNAQVRSSNLLAGSSQKLRDLVYSALDLLHLNVYMGTTIEILQSGSEGEGPDPGAAILPPQA